jgi:heptaprenyl diphosphate synthase
MEEKQTMPNQTRSPGSKIPEIIAILGAVCFFLSVLEYAIPKPLPFIRLGISNLPLLIAVDILPFGWFIVLAVVKVFGMSLMSGSLFSYIFLFSLAGTMASALSMFGIRLLFKTSISHLGISVTGAIASNVSQIFLASVFIFGPSALYIAPFFLGMGLVTGIALGLFTARFIPKSRWYEMMQADALV